MSNLMTSTEIKDIVTPVVAFDPSFFSTSLDYIEKTIIKCILTEAYYNDLVAKVALLPGTPLSAADKAAKRILATIKQREFDYCKELGDFLIDNKANYPLFDSDKISYEPNFRRFFPI